MNPEIIKSWRDRVARANTPADMDKLDASLTRLWGAGTLTHAEFVRMDSMACDRRRDLTL